MEDGGVQNTRSGAGQGGSLRHPDAVPASTSAACLLVLQKVASELHPKVRNHGEGPY